MPAGHRLRSSRSSGSSPRVRVALGASPTRFRPVGLLYELDADPSAEEAAILRSLLSVGSSQERLEFLGYTDGSPCGAGSRGAQRTRRRRDGLELIGG